MDLSIVIVNWRSARYLWSCLASIVTQSQTISYEVIVVNNDPRDNLEDLCRAFRVVRQIEAGANLGFTRANNLGFRHSRGEYVLFMNPDTEIIGDCLGRMVSYLRVNSTVGAVGARLLNSDGSLQTSCVQAFPTIWNQIVDCDILRRWFPGWRVWGVRSLVDEQSPEAEVISGACFMVRCRVFEQVEGFDEHYFMYADDLDLSYRIGRAGYKIHCLNRCQVVHHGGKSACQQKDTFADVLKRASLATFLRKTRGPVYSWGYRKSTSIIALIRIALVIIAMPFKHTGLLQGNSSRTVLRKWWSVFLWSLGMMPVSVSSVVRLRSNLSV